MATINVMRKFALHDYDSNVRHEFLPGVQEVDDALVDPDHPLSWWVLANTDQESGIVEKRTKHNAASRYNAQQEMLTQAKQRERLEGEANRIHQMRINAPADALAAAHAEVARLQAIVDAHNVPPPITPSDAAPDFSVTPGDLPPTVADPTVDEPASADDAKPADKRRK